MNRAMSCRRKFPHDSTVVSLYNGRTFSQAMFNRYSLNRIQGLSSRFHVTAGEPEYLRPRYNVCRGQSMPIVVNKGGERYLEWSAWGLVPRWATDTSQDFITAAAATVAERPSSKRAFRSQRCLVPANSFFAWRTD